MSKADDFIEMMAAKMQLSVDELQHAGDVIDTEDMEVILKMINDMVSVNVILSLGPTLALTSAFIAGMVWARYRAETVSPINDMLDGVKGL